MSTNHLYQLSKSVEKSAGHQLNDSQITQLKKT